MYPGIWGLRVDLKGLEEAVTDEKIKKVVQKLKSDRAPGPDGFPLLFYKEFQPFSKDDIIRLVKDFMARRTNLDNINYSQLFLNPKNKVSASVKEFRPIALLNGSLKIISKVLTNRLLPLLTNLIGDYRSCFMKGRNILEGVAEAHEIIHQASKT